MKIHRSYPIAIALCLLSWWSKAQQLTDARATATTQILYKNLYQLSQKNTLFGHQDDLAYGVNWKYVKGNSDIKAVVNDYPAVYGWDMARIELDSARNIDGVPFEKMRQYIKEGYQRGGVITLSWHFNNPLNGGSSWDTTQNAVASILPGGAKHELYKSWLDKASRFMHSLKGSKGEAIPILFRPFHELTGDWFWWGSKTSTPAQLKAAWRFTINYLRKEKQLHNLIVVYNTNDFTTEAAYLERYPGDDVVDLLSFDHYQFDTQSQKDFIKAVRHEMTLLTQIAKAKHKPMAFAETGYEAIPVANWWTQALWPAIKNFPVAYVLVWRNAGYSPSMKKMHYYAPYPGQASANDFKKIYQNPKILFEKKLRTLKIYQAKK